MCIRCGNCRVTRLWYDCCRKEVLRREGIFWSASKKLVNDASEPACRLQNEVSVQGEMKQSRLTITSTVTLHFAVDLGTVWLAQPAVNLQHEGVSAFSSSRTCAFLHGYK